MLHAYRRGFQQAREAMRADFEAMRTRLECEFALLLVEVRTLKAEHSRAREIVDALETEREYGARLQ
jgi:hypothetical protein